MASEAEITKMIDKLFMKYDVDGNGYLDKN